MKKTDGPVVMQDTIAWEQQEACQMIEQALKTWTKKDRDEMIIVGGPTRSTIHRRRR